MGRYNPREHDSFLRCEKEGCGARNAPADTVEYDTECWRCGEPLGGKPEVGDVVEVDVVDETERGEAVCKTKNGFVLFVNRELATIEATVQVTEVEETSGQAEVVET
ncbi:TRAM domain-containing protein [Salinibaculum rarum]|uniref:TRAM domain-containing protein n=1 Tax=Salinibaculum rarum TaxID=3058903 RepID=UPI00265E48BF|nr:TRAM domain-containing protein [Salinibaculum sp. KK48]